MPSSETPADDLPLLELLREDLRRHDRQLSRPGLHAVVVHRIGRRTLGSPHLLHRVAHRLARGAHVLVRNLYGIEIAFTVELGRRVRIAHQGMIVVNDACRIGNDCLLRHGVTLGAYSEERIDEVPELRDGVEVGVNAVIVGAVVIGEHARIGPSAVVFEDVPAGALALAAPARLRTRAGAVRLA
jgi:serine O-acetyltransferase